MVKMNSFNLSRSYSSIESIENEDDIDELAVAGSPSCLPLAGKIFTINAGLF